MDFDFVTLIIVRFYHAFAFVYRCVDDIIYFLRLSNIIFTK